VGRVLLHRAHPPEHASGRVAHLRAHDLLVLEDGTLVPTVFVVDREPGVVVVDVPDGLLDVNR